jgi:hypothetical protein
MFFLTLKDRPPFLEQISTAWELHRRQARAAGTCVAYRLDDLRSVVEHHLAQGVCPYCRGPVTPTNFAIDHKIPIARGGKFSFRNLEICCRECAACKGVLDAQEFRELLLLVRTWPKPVQKLFRARLAAAAAGSTADLPRPGSLEWFSGSDQPHPPPLPRRRYSYQRTGTDSATPGPEETSHEVHHG